MTSAPNQSAIRAVFVYPQRDERTIPPTHRLLSELGHEVTTFTDLGDAIDMMEQSSVDLLILEEDLATVPEGKDSYKNFVLDRLGKLDIHHRPREVAIFSEHADEASSSTRSGIKVHTLLKPLHMHGLLHMLRHLEAKMVH